VIPADLTPTECYLIKKILTFLCFKNAARTVRRICAARSPEITPEALRAAPWTLDQQWSGRHLKGYAVRGRRIGWVLVR
jgi:hypothetical protein